MTRKIMNTLFAAIAVLTIGSTALPEEAAAGGSVTVSVTPRNAQDEQALRTGLAIYGMVNAIQNGASIRQNGFNNFAGIGQAGAGNFGVVHQEGNGHNGSLQQNGNHNAHGLFQFGKNTNGHVVQNGNGQTGATFQFGW